MARGAALPRARPTEGTQGQRPPSVDHGSCWKLWEVALLTQDGRNKTPEPLITVASAECAYSGGSCLQSTSPASGRPPEHARWLIASVPKGRVACPVPGATSQECSHRGSGGFPWFPHRLSTPCKGRCGGSGGIPPFDPSAFPSRQPGGMGWAQLGPTLPGELGKDEEAMPGLPWEQGELLRVGNTKPTST